MGQPEPNLKKKREGLWDSKQKRDKELHELSLIQ